MDVDPCVGAHAEVVVGHFITIMSTSCAYDLEQKRTKRAPQMLKTPQRSNTPKAIVTRHRRVAVELNVCELQLSFAAYRARWKGNQRFCGRLDLRGGETRAFG